MLKDLADSKRLDANVRALPEQQMQAGFSTAQPQLSPGPAAALSRLRATVCSYLFWPELPEHEMKLPHDLQVALEVRHCRGPMPLCCWPMPRLCSAFCLQCCGCPSTSLAKRDGTKFDFVSIVFCLPFLCNTPSLG